MTYTITHNEAFKSLEITFDGKPAAAVRDALKALKFRWHSVKKLWYGYSTEDEVRAAIDGKPVKAAKPAKAHKAVEKANKFGVKVGDLFHASWGYDQTNNDFFQVVELVGEQSVRVREVSPVCVASEASGPDAEHRVFSTNTHGKLLPATSFSVFIKDQEKGDIKRLKSYDADGKSNPIFNLSSYASACHCGGDTIRVYESWYA